MCIRDSHPPVRDAGPQADARPGPVHGQTTGGVGEPHPQEGRLGRQAVETGRDAPHTVPGRQQGPGVGTQPARDLMDIVLVHLQPFDGQVHAVAGDIGQAAVGQGQDAARAGVDAARQVEVQPRPAIQRRLEPCLLYTSPSPRD